VRRFELAWQAQFAGALNQAVKRELEPLGWSCSYIRETGMLVCRDPAGRQIAVSLAAKHDMEDPVTAAESLVRRALESA
jgi:hypothetical protein